MDERLKILVDTVNIPVDSSQIDQTNKQLDKLSDKITGINKINFMISRNAGDFSELQEEFKKIGIDVKDINDAKNLVQQLNNFTMEVRNTISIISRSLQNSQRDLLIKQANENLPKSIKQSQEVQRQEAINRGKSIVSEIPKRESVKDYYLIRGIPASQARRQLIKITSGKEYSQQQKDELFEALLRDYTYRFNLQQKGEKVKQTRRSAVKNSSESSLLEENFLSFISEDGKIIPGTRLVDGEIVPNKSLKISSPNSIKVPKNLQELLKNNGIFHFQDLKDSSFTELSKAYEILTTTIGDNGKLLKGAESLVNNIFNSVVKAYLNSTDETLRKRLEEILTQTSFEYVDSSSIPTYERTPNYSGRAGSKLADRLRTQSPLSVSTSRFDGIIEQDNKAQGGTKNLTPKEFNLEQRIENEKVLLRQLEKNAEVSKSTREQVNQILNEVLNDSMFLSQQTINGKLETPQEAYNRIREVLYHMLSQFYENLPELLEQTSQQVFGVSYAKGIGDTQRDILYDVDRGASSQREREKSIIGFNPHSDNPDKDEYLITDIDKSLNSRQTDLSETVSRLKTLGDLRDILNNALNIKGIDNAQLKENIGKIISVFKELTQIDGLNEFNAGIISDFVNTLEKLSNEIPETSDYREEMKRAINNNISFQGTHVANVADLTDTKIMDLQIGIEESQITNLLLRKADDFIEEKEVVEEQAIEKEKSILDSYFDQLSTKLKMNSSRQNGPDSELLKMVRLAETIDQVIWRKTDFEGVGLSELEKSSNYDSFKTAYNQLANLMNFADLQDISIKKRVNAINEKAGRQVLDYDTAFKEWRENNPEQAKQYDLSRQVQETFVNNGGFVDIEQALNEVFKIENDTIKGIKKVYEGLSGTISRIEKVVDENGKETEVEVGKQYVKDLFHANLYARMDRTREEENPDKKEGEKYYKRERIRGEQVPIQEMSYSMKSKLQYQAGYTGYAYGGNSIDENIKLAQQKLKQLEELFQQLDNMSDKDYQANLEKGLREYKSNIAKEKGWTPKGENGEYSNRQLAQIRLTEEELSNLNQKLTNDMIDFHQRIKAEILQTQEDIQTLIKAKEPIDETKKSQNMTTEEYVKKHNKVYGVVDLNGPVKQEERTETKLEEPLQIGEQIKTKYLEGIITGINKEKGTFDLFVGEGQNKGKELHGMTMEWATKFITERIAPDMEKGVEEAIKEYRSSFEHKPIMESELPIIGQVKESISDSKEIPLSDLNNNPPTDISSGNINIDSANVIIKEGKPVNIENGTPININGAENIETNLNDQNLNNKDNISNGELPFTIDGESIKQTQSTQLTDNQEQFIQKLGEAIQPLVELGEIFTNSNTQENWENFKDDGSGYERNNTDYTKELEWAKNNYLKYYKLENKSALEAEKLSSRLNEAEKRGKTDEIDVLRQMIADQNKQTEYFRSRKLSGIDSKIYGSEQDFISRADSIVKGSVSFKDELAQIDRELREKFGEGTIKDIKTKEKTLSDTIKEYTDLIKLIEEASQKIEKLDVDIQNTEEDSNKRPLLEQKRNLLEQQRTNLEQQRTNLLNDKNLNLTYQDGKIVAGNYKGQDLTQEQIEAIRLLEQELQTKKEIAIIDQQMKYAKDDSVKATDITNQKEINQALDNYFKIKKQIARLDAEQKANKGLIEQGVNSKTRRELKERNKQLQLRINELENQAGNYDNSTGKFTYSKDGKVQSATLTDEQRYKMQKQINDLKYYETEQTEKTNRKLKEQKGILQTLVDNFKRSITNLIDYELAGEVMRGIRTTVNAVIQNTKELNSNMVDLQIASGETYENIYGLTKEFNNLGRELGRSTKEVQQAANDWLRAGFTSNQAAELTKASMELSTLGMINASDATSYLISVMKGWKLSAKEISTVNDKLVAVDMNAATSAGRNIA